MIVTETMLEAALASTVLGKIETSGDEGYVCAPEERKTCEFLSRKGLVTSATELQDPSEGYGARVRWYVREEETEWRQR